jgi:hypothetical protein
MRCSSGTGAPDIPTTGGGVFVDHGRKNEVKQRGDVRAAAVERHTFVMVTTRNLRGSDGSPVGIRPEPTLAAAVNSRTQPAKTLLRYLCEVHGDLLKAHQS